MGTHPARSPHRGAGPQSFLGCCRHFLTPQGWKPVHQPCWHYHAIRWQAQPLLLVLLVMTWCAGGSQAERFETARAFSVASYPRQRRPGKAPAGFDKALARLPAAALRQVAAAVRRRLQQVFAGRLAVEGFIPLGCDGTRLNVPARPLVFLRRELYPPGL